MAKEVDDCVDFWGVDGWDHVEEDEQVDDEEEVDVEGAC